MSGFNSSLKGKNALITGSSMGIGRATALRLAEGGANVAVNYLKHKEKAEEIVAQIKKMGRKSFQLQADVRVFEQVERLVNSAAEKFGHLDILVNNAGIVEDHTLLKMSLSEWDNVLRTNLSGVFYCSKLAAADMARRGNGRIINISSIIGQMGGFGQTNYAASKAGVLGFTKSLARELADKGVTVNAVCPGFIDTDMVRRMPEAVKQDLLQRIPLKRFGKPEEVAELIVFLASDRASYITGQAFNVNGGLYM